MLPCPFSVNPTISPSAACRRDDPERVVLPAGRHVAQLLARAGYPAVTLDMQHGEHDFASLAATIPAVVAAGATPVVRVPVGEFATASRAVDAGAAAVIAPMIDDAATARRFVAQIKYPPLGERSWGPASAMALAGVTDPLGWLETANRATLAFAMIETRAAFEGLDDILAVPGLDGVFVGPADLSIALSNGAHVAPSAESTHAAGREDRRAARAAGRIAGYFAPSVEDALKAQAAGFTFISLGIDAAIIAEAGRAKLAAFEAGA